MLLRAAFDEIYRCGFQAASLSSMLGSTGLTKGAVYHYFPNKLAMGYAVVDEIIRDWVLSQWLEPLETIDNPIDALQKPIRDIDDSMSDRLLNFGCPLNNLAQEMSSIDEGFRQRLEEIFRDWRALIRRALERGKRKGYVRWEINSRQVAAMLVGALEGCTGMAKNARDIELLLQCRCELIRYLENLRC
ncbi:MAG: TetR/AcrR family transcriptional regulator [Pseudomonadota bacterium]